MTKYFCDHCGDEIAFSNEARGGRLSGSTTKSVTLSVEVIATSPREAALFCKYCILDTVIALDDRPRAEARR